jgi:hypothetical protein
MSEETQYSNVVNQIKAELKTNTLIANKYGIILGSEIPELEIGKVIPPDILDLINKRERLAKSLNLKFIDSISLESENHYLLITSNEKLILMAQLDKKIDLSNFIPSLKTFLVNLAKERIKKAETEFSDFDFEKEIKRLEESLVLNDDKKVKFNIIKELINYIS